MLQGNYFILVEIIIVFFHERSGFKLFQRY